MPGRIGIRHHQPAPLRQRRNLQGARHRFRHQAQAMAVAADQQALLIHPHAHRVAAADCAIDADIGTQAVGEARKQSHGAGSKAGSDCSARHLHGTQRRTTRTDTARAIALPAEALPGTLTRPWAIVSGPGGRQPRARKFYIPRQ